MGTDKGGKRAPGIGIYRPPPFIGCWENPNQFGMGTKNSSPPKKNHKNKVRGRPTVTKRQSVQQYTTPWNDTIKPNFHKNIPLSNYDLMKRC